MQKYILVTGGAGYIGSHTVVELCASGYLPVIADNFSNSSPEVINRLSRITGTEIPCHRVDVGDQAALEELFDQYTFDAAIHFSGLKAVGESVAEPLRYYRTNVGTALTLAETMAKKGVKKLIFSSTATVYGDPSEKPITEDFPLHPQSPYARTKLVIEDMLRDLSVSDPNWNITILRYFNPIGAHESGLIGEDPAGVPNNLLPFVAQVAVGKRAQVTVFGNDYDTPDGTGIRDYLHVTDLAKGHVHALQYVGESGVHTYNLGTGKGYSVLEVINAFEQAADKPIPYEISGRRPGDISKYFADASKAEKELRWKAKKTLHDMCVDTWHWQQQNPAGYTEETNHTLGEIQ
jgi:UDP-glucose 4-epimerase